MRTGCTIVLSVCLFISCHSRPAKVRSIGIQPIDFPDTAKLAFVQRQLAAFFHCPVYILQPVAMPQGFLDLSKGERYSADSVLDWLARRRNNSIDVALGLTRKDIFIAERDAFGWIREPADRYAVWGILGLGNCPGRVCVVSDARFYGRAPGLYAHRLRTLIIHELGHNLGLPHCKSPHCIMNDANEQIATVDSSGDEFCSECRRVLGKR
jgi:archaemetzincin